MDFDPGDTAVVVSDPQTDVLSPSAKNWEVLEASVTENNTVGIEQGFEVAVVRDATAGPRHPSRVDGYQAALVNFAFLAHAVLSTDDVIEAMTAPTGGAT